jgi:HD-like signal output (HDOD) protein
VLTETALQTDSTPPAQPKPALVESAPNVSGFFDRFNSTGRSDLPGLPVMPETLLLLELKLYEPCVNLREFSELVLSDLGAAVQVLRLAGREYGNAEGRPSRIEDCIADLGLEACVEAVAAQPLTRDSNYHAIVETWTHSREIAHYTRLAAEETSDVNPEEAYLVGLLHAIGTLPSLLSWPVKDAGAVDATLAGFRMARSWALPAGVMEFFCEMSLPGYTPHWSALVRAAHQRASRSSIDCSFQNNIRPHLHRCG